MKISLFSFLFVLLVVVFSGCSTVIEVGDSRVYKIKGRGTVHYKDDNVEFSREIALFKMPDLNLNAVKE